MNERNETMMKMLDPIKIADNPEKLLKSTPSSIPTTINRSSPQKRQCQTRIRKRRSSQNCAIIKMLLFASFLNATFFVFGQCHVVAAINENGKADDFLSDDRKIVQPSDFQPKRVSFQEWVNSTNKANGRFFNHSSVAEGEVLLFKTKKNKHRAIPVMRSSPMGISSRFSDALTFKEWLQKTYPEEKAIRISVRTTDVVRPVLQHLYAARHDFTAPIIVHANTFTSKDSMEKSVDPVIFIETVQKLLPEATISLGWTPSSNYAALNRLDWSKTFRLMSYLSELRQPVMLTMNLNDVLHSLEQLEWLLGISEPEIFLLVKADATAFVDADFQRLSSISENDKILFDVDDGWRRKLRHLEPKIPKKRRRSVEPEKWRNRIFPSSHSMLSTNIISKTGIAFLGWPNALLLSNNEVQSYPSKQIVTGKIMFHPKRQLRDITPLRDSGMLLQFFEKNLLTIDSPKVDDSVTVLIGYDGRITISNNLRRSDPLYYESSSGQLPKSPCYEFKVTDKGWKIDAEVWTSPCHGTTKEQKLLSSSSTSSSNSEDQAPIYRTFLSLDTPISRNRKLRNIGISKSGDGAIDFLLQELEHSAASSLPKLSFICVLFSIILTFILRV